MARPVSKRGVRWTPGDWVKNVNLTSVDVANRISGSRDECYSTLRLSDDLQIVSKWAQRHSERLFNERIEQVLQWRYRLERVLEDVDKSISEIMTIKDVTESETEEKIRLQEVNKFCIVTRDRRQNLELVADQVQEELTKEAQMLEEAKELLEAKSKLLFDQLCDLRQIKDDLEEQLMKKDLNIDVDKEQFEMREENEKSLKPYAEEAAKETEEADRWMEKNGNRIDYARAEIEKARGLKCSCVDLIASLRGQWMTQKEVTDFEYRKRIHQIKMAVNQLTWDKKKLISEAEYAREIIRKIESEWRMRKGVLKMAETRLERRKFKPEGERTEDEVSKGLMREVDWNKDAQERMKERAAECKFKVNEIEQALRVVDDNIQDKQRAIQTEEECVEERLKLN